MSKSKTDTKVIKTKNGKKLALNKGQLEGLWDIRGPYSEANLIVETRILNEQIHRVWVKVEVLINPLTFDLVSKFIGDFVSDHRIYTILIWAEYDKKANGYVSCVFSAPYKQGVIDIANRILTETEESIIRMHKFLINNFDLEKN